MELLCNCSLTLWWECTSNDSYEHQLQRLLLQWRSFIQDTIGKSYLFKGHWERPNFDFVQNCYGCINPHNLQGQELKELFLLLV